MSDRLDLNLTKLHGLLTELLSGQRIAIAVDPETIMYLESRAEDLLEGIRQTSIRIEETEETEETEHYNAD